MTQTGLWEPRTSFSWEARMLMNLFVQLWTPRAGEPSIVAGGEAGPEAVDAARVMAENQLQMGRQQEIGL